MAEYTMLKKDIPTPKCWDEDMSDLDKIETMINIKKMANFEVSYSDSGDFIEWSIRRDIPLQTCPYRGIASKSKVKENVYRGNTIDMLSNPLAFEDYVFLWRWVNGLCPKCGGVMQWIEEDKTLEQQCKNLYKNCSFIDSFYLRGTHHIFDR